jgi:ribonuclease HI
MAIAEGRLPVAHLKALEKLYNCHVNCNNGLYLLAPKSWREVYTLGNTQHFLGKQFCRGEFTIKIFVVHAPNEDGDRSAMIEELLCLGVDRQSIYLGDWNETNLTLAKRLASVGLKPLGITQATHFRTQAQQLTPGYASRQIDEIYANVKASWWQLIPAKTWSDHVMVTANFSITASSDVVRFQRVTVARKAISSEDLQSLLFLHKPSSLEDLRYRIKISRPVATGIEAFIRLLGNAVERQSAPDSEILYWTNWFKTYRNEVAQVEEPGSALGRWKTEVHQCEFEKACKSRVHPRTLADQLTKLALVKMRNKANKWTIVEKGVTIADWDLIVDKSTEWTEKAARSMGRRVGGWPQEHLETIPGLSVEQQGKLEVLGVSEEEVMKVMQEVGTKTGPGTDGWAPSALRGLDMRERECVAKMIITWIRGLCVTGDFESDVGHTTMTYIPKREQALTLADLRPIELDSTPIKILSKMAAKRMQETPELFGTDQFGFVRHRSARTAQALVEAFMLRGDTLLLLDIKGAYSNVEYPILQDVLSRWKVPESFSNIVRALGKPRVTHIIFAGRKGRRGARMEKGLRQGNSLSPALFNAYIAPVIARLARKYAGIAEFILFADDVTVRIAREAMKVGLIDDIVSDLLFVLEEVGLSLSISKTQIWRGAADILFIPSELRSYCVCEVKYLGVWFPASGDLADRNMKEKLQASASMCGVLNSLKPSLYTKAIAYNAMVWSRWIYVGRIIPLASGIVSRLVQMAHRAFAFCCRSGRTLGREVGKLADDYSWGGIRLINPSVATQAITATWFNYRSKAAYWPLKYADMLEPIILRKTRSLHADTVRAYNCAPIKTVGAIRGQMGEVREITANIICWKKLFHNATKLSAANKDLLWRQVFDVEPCHETLLRFAEVVERAPCQWCREQVINGYTHMASCYGFWSQRIWRQKDALAHQGWRKFVSTAGPDDLATICMAWRDFNNIRNNENLSNEFIRPSKRRRIQEEPAGLVRAYEGLAKSIPFRMVRDINDISVNYFDTDQCTTLVGPLEMFTDGSVAGLSAAWGLYVPNLNITLGGGLPPPGTNNRAELWGVAAALIVKERLKVTAEIRSDSLYTVQGLKRLSTPITNEDLWSEVRRIWKSCGAVGAELQWIKAHSGSWGNCIADQVAKKTAIIIEEQRLRITDISISMPPPPQDKPPPSQ